MNGLGLTSPTILSRCSELMYNSDMDQIKVLSIGSDRNLFTEGSAVSERIKQYGDLVGELHIVVFALSSLGLKQKQLSPHVWIYPTNSWSRFVYIFDAARIGKKIVSQQAFVRGRSLITAQDPFESGYAALRIKRRWRLPLEVQLHTDPFSAYFSGFLNTLRRRMARTVLRQADTVRVVSQSLLDKVVSEFNFDTSKAGVLPIYVDVQKIENAKISFDLHARFGWHFIMLAVARLTSEKNVAQAIRVLKHVRDYFPDTGLVIVGDGPERKNLESLAASLGVSAGVSFVGWQEDTASYYHTANLFIQTSRFEGYGLALVEAGLSGLPVVTTPVGIAEELLNGSDAIICPQDDEEYMFKAVYDLVKDNAKRDIMRMRLKKALEEKLMPKDLYLAKLKEDWLRTASLAR